MALAVVSDLDLAGLAGGDGIASEVASRAATAFFHTRDEQRSVTGVGEMEGIGHYFALKDLPEIIFGFVELQDGFRTAGIGGRLGIGHQIAGKVFVTGPGGLAGNQQRYHPDDKQLDYSFHLN